MENKNILEVSNLCKNFKINKKTILKAVDDVTFTIKQGETLGLVGESGCGKTTCGRTVLGIYDKSSGSIKFEGKEIHSLRGKEFLEFKKNAQMIFQDPYASLDPRLTIGDIISEGINVHFKNETKEQKNNRVNKLIDEVGLNRDYANRFSHELSGGQRQRIGIARALAVEPKFIVCDEPISALDVSIQAQIVNLLIDLQKKYKMAYLFISHDLSMVKHISDKVGVMYLGSIAELALNEKIYNNPMHPYTKALISAIPVADPDIEEIRQRIKLEGEVPSPINTPPGCKFKQRCKEAAKICSEISPKLKQIEDEHFVACHAVK